MKSNHPSLDSSTPTMQIAHWLPARVILISITSLAMISLAIAYLLLPSAAFAQSQAGPLGSGGQSSGIIQDSNERHIWNIRKDYYLRFPFAKLAGPMHPKENPQGNDILVVAGIQQQESGAKVEIKRSDGPGFGKVLAYDICHVHCDGVGHWLPGAEIYHQPQIPCPLPACYFQPKLWAFDVPATKRDNELFLTALGTYGGKPQVNLAGVNGLPLSDTQFQIIDRENNQRFLELLYDPERFVWMSTSVGQIQGTALANSEAGAAEKSFNNAYDRVRNENLINMANENALVPTSAQNPKKTIPQACWMVMKMYKELYLPMALLFLLPGAVLTQVQSFVHKGMLAGEGRMNMPFEGILRSMIAIFLIPATQMIVSYCIDIGNTMANSVAQWVVQETIFDWAHEQSYNCPQSNILNYIPPPEPIKTEWGVTQEKPTPGSGEHGKGLEASEDEAVQEEQLFLSQVVQLAFNMAIHAFSYAVIVLTGFQLVYMCYLFLLGPLSACFFAWPALEGGAHLFRDVFSKWLNAVITISLWRFYWCVILAIMTVRLQWLADLGMKHTTLTFEMMVFTCFLGLMLYVPFAPFQFDPGGAVTAVLQQGASMGSSMSQGLQQAGKEMGIPESTMKSVTGPMDQAVGQVGQVAGGMVHDTQMQMAARGLLPADASHGGGHGAGQGAGGHGGGGSGGGGGGGSTAVSDSHVSSTGGGGHSAGGPPMTTNQQMAMLSQPMMTPQTQTLLGGMAQMGVQNMGLPPSGTQSPMPLTPQAPIASGLPTSGNQSTFIPTNAAIPMGQIAQALPALMQNPQLQQAMNIAPLGTLAQVVSANINVSSSATPAPPAPPAGTPTTTQASNPPPVTQPQQTPPPSGGQNIPPPPPPPPPAPPGGPTKST